MLLFDDVCDVVDDCVYCVVDYCVYCVIVVYVGVVDVGVV